MGLFSSTPKAEGPIDGLFKFLRGLVNREDLIVNIWGKYKSGNLVSAYVDFEEFIITNRPLVTKKEFTRGELRQEVIKNVKTQDLPDELKIFFITGASLDDIFFKLISRPLIEYITSNLGESIANDTVQRAENKRVQFRLLYEKTNSSFGRETADKLVRKSYELIASSYGHEWLARFFEFIPEGLLANERLSYLSEKQLTQKVFEATKTERERFATEEALYKELQARTAQIEEQNKLLENSKNAMMNILEDDKKLQETLKIEKDRISLIITSIGEGLLTIDASYKITMMNKAAEKLLEIKETDALGRDWHEVIKTYKGEKETPVEERSFAKSVSEGQVIIVNLEDNHFYKTPSERVFPIISITAPLRSGGKIVGAVKVFRDATPERVAKEEIENKVIERTKELSEEKTRFISSIEGMISGYVLFAPEGKVILTNHRVSEILGPTKGLWHIESLQEKLKGIVDITGTLKNCIATKSSFEIKEATLGTKYLNIHIAPISMIEGGITKNVGVLMLIRDITEEKVLDRSKEEFFSIASHELRTPLTAIKGNASLIRQMYWDKLPDEDLKEMISDMGEASERLIDIVNDFLNMGRLEQKRMVFKNEALDIYTLISLSVGELANTARTKGLSLNFEDGKDLPKVRADPERVKEILVNLIGNSIKFTDKGSILVKASREGSFVRVEIIDSGRGIPVENQSLLFRKFTQAGSSLFTRDTTKGTGLGLYISKLMAEGMGGTIGLGSSTPGKGSIFYFTLPTD